MSQEPRPLQWTDELVARFWAYQSRFPENYFSFKSGAAVAAYLRRVVPVGADVLDYGCGPGHFIPHLLAAGYKVTGADVDDGTIGVAVDVSGHSGFNGFASIGRLIKDGRQFDAVVLLEVIEHLDDAWLATTLSNARNLLRPGGLLFVTTPNEERLEDSVVYCPASNATFHRWQHVRVWSRDSLADCLRRSGFADVGTQVLTFAEARAPHVAPARWLASKLLARLRKPKSLVATARSP
jgi:SAM-dependent methyltransferase